MLFCHVVSKDWILFINEHLQRSKHKTPLQNQGLADIKCTRKGGQGCIESRVQGVKMYCEDSSHDMLAVYITKMEHLGQARIHNKPIKYTTKEQTLPPPKCKMYYIYLNIR